MEKIAVLTTVFNHTSSPYFKTNWSIFLDFLDKNKLLPNLYVCEVLKPTETSIIKGSIAHNHYIVTNNSILWHKESAINFLLNKISNEYQYVLILDNDIVFQENNWYDKTLCLLQQHIMVQPFDSILYLDKKNKNIEYKNIGAAYDIINNRSINTGNPGIALAYHREYLNHTKGLFDLCLIGGGDIINILPFIYQTCPVNLTFWESTFKDCRGQIIDYIMRARDFLVKTKLKPIGYLSDNAAKHHFHGYWKHRQYDTRFNIIKNQYYNDCVFDRLDGFYEIKNNTFKNKINKFFNYRYSNNAKNKPQIICSNKYGTDSESVRWLGKNNIFYFENISKVKLTIEKNHKIDSLIIQHDDTQIDISDLLLKDKMILNIDNPNILSIYCDDSFTVNGDIRELSIFISNIEVIKDLSDSLEKYSLYDIL